MAIGSLLKLHGFGIKKPNPCEANDIVTDTGDVVRVVSPPDPRCPKMAGWVPVKKFQNGGLSLGNFFPLSNKRPK